MPFEQCHYPGCKLKGITSFALVPLCDRHRYLIMEETKRFYTDRNLDYFDREHYLQIAELIPWSLANQKLE